LEGSQGIRREKVAPPWLGESHGGVNLLLLTGDTVAVAIQMVGFLTDLSLRAAADGSFRRRSDAVPARSEAF
jgi:hypothetical protein